MIENEIAEFITKLDIGPLIYLKSDFNEHKSRNDSITVAFLFQKKQLEISYAFGRDIMHVHRHIPTKNKEAAASIVKITNELLIFLKSDSSFRLRFAVDEPEIYIHGEPYESYIRKSIEVGL